MLPFALAFQLWTSFTTPISRADGAILYGNWQSCMDDTGDYAERIYYHKVNGKLLWSFHFGPYDEFALFAGDPGDLEHDDPLNLLAPAYKFNVNAPKTGRNWTSSKLNLRVNVVAAMGSRAECQSFVVKVEKMK